MKIFRFKAAILGVVLCSTQIHAFSQNKEIIKQDVINAIKNVEEKKIFHDAGVPRFILLDRENKFAFGIGGVLSATAGSEFGGIINTPINEGMQPSFIPLSYDGLPHSQLRMSGATSQIFMKMVGSTKRVGNIETFISIDFHGENYTPRLRQAYLKLGGFTFGQAWSAMTDLNATSPTIDYSGAISVVDVRTPLIKYERTFYEKKFKAVLSIEFPEVGATYSKYTKSIPQSVPDVIGYFQHNWGLNKENHVRVSGLLRNMSYYDKIKTQAEIAQGWGAQLSSRINLCREVRFFGQAIYGYGVARYMNDPSNLNVDLIPCSFNQGFMEPLKTWGFAAGLQYNITKDLFTSATYSYNRLYQRKGITLEPTTYQYGQYIVTNIFWSFISDCTIGIEYLRGTRTTFNDTFGKANRMNLLVQYAF